MALEIMSMIILTFSPTMIRITAFILRGHPGWTAVLTKRAEGEQQKVLDKEG